MKVIFYTKYSNKGASSRLRSFQYFPYLKEHGSEVKVKPLFNDLYLERLYAGKNVLLAIIIAYVNRFINLWWIFWADRIVIEKELFPYFPAWFEHLLATMGKHYIVDYDDAIFHNYDQHPRKVIRKTLSNKIPTVMRLAKVVVAGNEYLKEIAINSGAAVVEVIPTVVDLERYKIVQNKNQRIVVGWIGTKTTFEKHFLPISAELMELQKIYGFDIHVIGVASISELESFQFIPWSEAREAQDISNFDIGIMPLQNSLWEKGKCAYKLIQYAAMGKPTVAADVGMNHEVCVNEITGFLYRTPQEFAVKLTDLIEDQTKREKMGRAGRVLVERKYDLAVTASKYFAIISGDGNIPQKTLTQSGKQ